MPRAAVDGLLASQQDPIKQNEICGVILGVFSAQFDLSANMGDLVDGCIDTNKSALDLSRLRGPSELRHMTEAMMIPEEPDHDLVRAGLNSTGPKHEPWTS
jgi:hypothetical protein